MTDFDLLKQEIQKAFPNETIPDKELSSMAWDLVDFFTMAAKAYKTIEAENNRVLSIK